MATYTDNYTMTKPTYAEQADIAVINANMDIIDGVMHSSQISLAPAYDSTATYNKGDVVMYELLMYKCKADNTTGVWDSTKWERTTASECGASEKLIGVASGQPASFPDGSDNALEACVVDINPVQDLHGYSKPWAGGAGKNLLPMDLTTIKSINTTGTWTDNEYLINGVTYTVETDDGGNVTGITANGQASANADISIVSSYNPTSDVYFNGCPTGGGASTYQFYISGRRGDYGNGSYLNTGESGRPYLRIFSGYNASNVLFKPMIRLQTVVDDTFEPYSNICPISGHTDVTVTVASTSGGSGDDTTVSLGRTVYGGTLDLTTGELTVTHAIVNLGSLRWTRTTDYTNPIFYAQITDKMNSSIDSICEWYANGGLITGPTTINALQNGYFGCGNNSKYIYVRDDQYTSVSDFTSATASVKFYYELATPQTVPLTPQEVRSILGQNYIEADSGNIEVAYVRDLNSCITNIISRIEALEQANSNRSLNLNRSLSKGTEELSEEPQEEEPEVKEEENNER